MKRSTFALFAAGMFVFAGASDLRAQDGDAGTADEAATETPSDVQIVEATILNPGAMEPMDLNVEFSGSGDELAAAITLPGMEMRIELTDLLITDDAFSFSFTAPGEDLVIDCSLFRLGDESFRGDCFAGDDGTSAEMTIGAFEE